MSEKNIYKEELVAKINNKNLIVAVIGLGYVGVTIGSGESKSGF